MSAPSRVEAIAAAIRGAAPHGAWILVHRDLGPTFVHGTSISCPCVPTRRDVTPRTDPEWLALDIVRAERESEA